MPKITTLEPLDPLKVFVEYDTQYEVYVAQCLQTGHLVTADDPDTAKEMITELLQDEVSLAVTKNNLSELLANPSPMPLWFKWELAWSTDSSDERTIKVSGNVPQELRMLVGHDKSALEVANKIRIATGTLAKSA